MLKEFIQKPKSWVPIVIVISVLFAGIYMLFTQSGNNALPAFVDAPTSQSEPAPKHILELEPYYEESVNLTISVPVGWQKITKDGFPTFVYNDGTSMQLQIMAYNPYMNMVTYDTVLNDVSSFGGIMGNYMQLNQSAYIVAYSIEGMNYIELNIWDRQTFIRVQFVMGVNDFNKYFDTCMAIFDSFDWNQADPIPANFFIFYSEFGNFEFGVPIEWSYAINDGVFAATSPSTGAIIYAAVVESDAVFDSITQLDYTQIMGANRSNFLMQSFTNDGNSIAAEATYFVGDTQYGMIQYRVCTGQFQYSFSFESRIDTIQQDMYYFQAAMQLFRFG